MKKKLILLLFSVMTITLNSCSENGSDTESGEMVGGLFTQGIITVEDVKTHHQFDIELSMSMYNLDNCITHSKSCPICNQQNKANIK